MRIKFLKDQKWRISGKIIAFKNGDIKEVNDSDIAEDMIRFGYGEKAKEKTEAKQISNYENKAIIPDDNKSEGRRSIFKRKGPGRPKKDKE